MTKRKNVNLFLFLILLLSGYLGNDSYAQVSIPAREGFPYCEPFTSTTPRQNTEIGGFFYNGPIKTPKTVSSMLPGGALQLTSAMADQTGFVYVDLPFSPVFGIRASFEYFAYGGTDPAADGLSFFLFDGAIDKTTFEIGGLGGALGYTPHRYNNGLLTSGGLKGAYLGIGLDERNFGNEFNGKLGSFKNPNSFIIGGATDQYINSVSLRGPVNSGDIFRDNGAGPGPFGVLPPFPVITPSYNSYQFITGKILNKPSDFHSIGSATPYLFNDPARFFTIGTTKLYRVVDCQEEGYRKVFIDLKPTGSGNYQVSMWMLVTTVDGNPRLEQIFNNVTYNFPAPQNLKIGFAAANGQDYSFHEIRNVTVEVSTEVEFPLITKQLDAEFCEGESIKDVIVEVPLNNDNSFIRCIQLYKLPSDVPNPPTFTPIWPNPNVNQSCLVDGVCSFNYCENGNASLTLPGKGQFEITGIDEKDQSGNIIGEIKVKFTADPAFTSGVATVWYTVTDNYGQVSDPQPININYTPLPKINPTAVKIGPTCNGQNDGSIENVIVTDLLPTSSFQWYKGDGINPSTGQIVNPVPLSGTIDGIQNINLGKYYLEVTNFFGGDGCRVFQEFIVTDVRGTPVEVVLDDQQICEGTPVIFNPQLEDPTDAQNPTFLWWKDNNKNQPITNNLKEGNITYEISPPGILTISGLPQSATPREFFVEVAADPLQNLCATPPGKLKRVQVVVLPPLNLNATVVDDLCLVGAGQIAVSAVGGFGTYTYSLDGGTPQSSNTFTGLFPGTYSVEVTAGTNCIGTISKEVLGAPELFLVEEKFFNPACGVPNGLIEVSFSGGTAGFTLELFRNGVLATGSNTPSSPTVYQDLAPGIYQVKITDANGCSRTIDRTLINDVGIPITVDPMVDEICEGDLATIIPIVNTSGNASLKWFKDPAATQEIISSPTADGSGITYTINSATMELNINGLKAGDHSYYLVSTGPGYCPNPPFKADIAVLTPITATITSTDEICDNAADGTLTVNASGADGNFEYSLNGGAFVTSNVFTGLAPGVYSIDVRSTGANGCSFQTTSTILGPPGPISINSPDIIRSSCDLDNGRIENLSISGGWSNYQVEWRKGSINGPVVSGGPTGIDDLLPDTYYLTITDDKGCSVNFDFLVEEMPDPIFVVAPVEICEGEDVLLTPINTVSGSADSEVKWYKNSALTQPIINGPDSANPAIIYSIDADGKLAIEGLPGAETPYSYYLESVCTGAVVQVEAMVRIVPDVQFETSPEICFGAADGKIKIVSGAIGSFEYSIDGGPPMQQAALEAMTFAPKVYSVSVSNAGLCVKDFTVEVLGPPSAITRTSFDEIRSSCNLSNGRIENVVITGGWGEYTSEWRKGSISGTIIPGDITGASNLSPDKYYLLVTDKEGCQESFEFTITEQPQPQFAVNTVEVCAGEMVTFDPVNTISGSSPTELKWYKDPGKTQPIQNGPDASNPNVIYSVDSNTGQLVVNGLIGSSSSYSFFLHVVCSDQLVEAKALVRVVPNPEFVTQPVTCFGGNDGKILVNSNGDPKYLYSVNGAAPISETQLEALSFSAKIYSIKVSNEGFCIVDFSVEVVQPEAPLKVENLGQVNPSCGANTGIIRTQITGGWSPYQVEVIKGGLLTNTITVQGPNFEILNLSPGSYSLKITDAGGCEISSNTADLVFGPTIIEVVDLEICEGQDAVFIPNAIPTAAGATFKWFKNSNLSSPIVSSPNPDGNGHVFQISSNGTLTISGLDYTDSPAIYYVTISGGTSCPGHIEEVRAIVNRNPSLKYSVQNEVCFGQKGTITLLATAGDGVFDYSLDGINFQSSNTFNVNPGIYSGFVKSGAGCMVSVPNIEVLGPPAPLVLSEPVKTDAICNSQTGSFSFDINGGYGNYTVIVNRNNQQYSSSQFTGGTFTIDNLPSGNYTIDVRDSGGCIQTIPGQIQIENLPTPLTGVGDVVCEGEIAEISASTTQAGINPVFTWYQNANGTGQISSGTVNGINYQTGSNGKLTITGLKGNSSPYIYYVKITGTDVCEPPLVPVEVMVHPIPNLRVSNPSIVCDPKGFVDLTQFIEGFNPSVYNYQILSPSGRLMRLDEIGQVVQSGSYLVQSSISGANCWTPNQRIQVLIAEEELIADFEYQADLGGGNFIPNAEAQIFEVVNFADSTLGNPIIWNWNFGDGTSSSEQHPAHIFEKKGTYTVSLTTIDNIGCISETQQVITVLDDYLIMVPNAFTPNGLKNQYFKPQFRGVASMEFYVFSTWGELIYHSSGLEALGWDGTVNGQLAPNGNYAYRAVFGTRSGIQVEKSGVFVLIR